MSLTYAPYRAKRVVNVYKHVDGAWFWTKYSAHPYIGCRCGCVFCYCRGGTWLGNRPPESFDNLIQVKSNAPELLDRELQRLPVDVVSAGDWQLPAEKEHRLSRRMLEVVLKRKFPLLIIERSPYLLEDLDLLQDISRKSWLCVVISMGTVNPHVKRAFEPGSSSIAHRLQMMEDLADAGILVGTAMMPVIPVLGDSDRQLRDTIQATADAGGRFVLAGGLTMEGLQADLTLEAALNLDPECEQKFRSIYRWNKGGTPRYAPTRDSHLRLGKKTRQFCQEIGIRDRIPRWLPKGRYYANKRVAEILFHRVYELELEQAAQKRIWEYRKAAWAIDELPRGIDELYRSKGLEGIERLSGISQSLAVEISEILGETDS